MEKITVCEVIYGAPTTPAVKGKVKVKVKVRNPRVFRSTVMLYTAFEENMATAVLLFRTEY